MQRLAQVDNSGNAPVRRTAPGRRSRKGATFTLGLFGGGLVGAVVLLAFEVVTPSQVRAYGEQGVAAVTAFLESWAFAPTTAPSETKLPAMASNAQPDEFEVIIGRTAHANAPFGLRLVGTEDAGVDILVRDVPAAAVLSRGERLDASTWALKAGDLKDLHLTLGSAAPDAFDLRIDVLASADVVVATAVARVRVVETRSVAAIEKAPAELMVAGADVSAVETPFRTEISVAKRKAPSSDKDRAERVAAAPSPAPVVGDAGQPQPRPWPEGASGLGALQPSFERQVWWKMPPPTWSPFRDQAAGHP